MAPRKPNKRTVAAKVQEKVETVIPEVKKTVEEKVIPEAKKVVDEKVIPETKKVVEAVKAVVPKKETETTLIVEYGGKQVEEKEMIDAVKAAWKASGSQEEIRTMKLYVKPEDAAVYYVINETETGSIAF